MMSSPHIFSVHLRTYMAHCAWHQQPPQSLAFPLITRHKACTLSWTLLCHHPTSIECEIESSQSSILVQKPSILVLPHHNTHAKKNLIAISFYFDAPLCFETKKVGVGVQSSTCRTLFFCLLRECIDTFK